MLTEPEGPRDLGPLLAREEPPEAELLRLEARKDGRPIASLRCLAADASYLVECAVFPVNGARQEAVARGPYRFPTLREASAFIDEASRALEYLGCSVA